MNKLITDIRLDITLPENLKLTEQVKSSLVKK